MATCAPRRCQLDIGHGSLRLPALPEAPLEVDGGSHQHRLRRRSPRRSRWQPSTLSWRGSRITHCRRRHQDSRARPSIRPGPTTCAPAKARSAPRNSTCPPVALDEWNASGRILPHRGEIELAEFKLRAGGADGRDDGQSRRRRRAGQHAARRHAQPDAAQHAEGAVAEGDRARRARSGSASACIAPPFWAASSASSAAMHMPAGPERRHRRSISCSFRHGRRRSRDAASSTICHPCRRHGATTRIENDGLEVVIAGRQHRARARSPRAAEGRPLHRRRHHERGADSARSCSPRSRPSAR